MTNAFNNQYTNMTSKVKDNLCDNNHEIIQELIQLRNGNDSSPNKDVQKMNSGLTIDGHIIELNESLAPPRLLFCSKRNDPEHVRKHCNLKYEAYRSCGEDKSTGNHNGCNICCHRCKTNHLATDYKCQFLMDYRRALLQRLKQKSYLLPPNVKLFIPTECRDDGEKNNKIVSSRNSMGNNTVFNGTSNDQAQHLPFNINSHSWSSLEKHRSNHINLTIDAALWKEIKNNENEIEKLREEFNNKIQLSQTIYQNENVEWCNTIINDFIPLLSSTLTLFQKLTTNYNEQNKMNGNTNETRQLVQYISNSIECMKERNDALITSQKSLNNLVDQQGLNTHVANVDLLLSNYQPHICILTGVGTAIHKQIKFPNYHSISQPGTNSSGGVVILYQFHIEWKVVEKYLNFLMIKLTSNHDDIHIGAIHVPPNSVPPFQLLSKYQNKSFYIFGDFNAKHKNWGCKMNNTSGVHLLNWFESTGNEIIAPTKPTSKRSDAIIDFGITHDAKG
ncbi:unnamed protein product [Rotaria magnacalcarata]